MDTYPYEKQNKVVKLTVEDKAVQPYHVCYSVNSVRTIKDACGNNYKHGTKINISPYLEPIAHRSLIIVTFSFYIIYRTKHMNVSQSIKEYL